MSKKRYDEGFRKLIKKYNISWYNKYRIDVGWGE